MLKRVNNFAALLVAATTVASLAPAVNAAERLKTEEGTIEKAIVFDDGKYLYDGYMTDDDESGLYFNNGSKDNFLEEDEDYELVDGNVKYGTKYVVVENDGDEYLLDLSTGKILDDECLEDIEENLEHKMKTTFNKVDRYESLKSVDLTQILKGQFGDVWYSYKVKGTDKISVEGEATTTPEVAAQVVATIEEANFGTEIKVAGKTFDGQSSSYTKETLVEAINQEVFDGCTATAEIDDVNVTVTLVKTGDNAVTAQEVDFGDFANATVVFTEGKAATTTPGTTEKVAIDCFGFVNENGKYIDASVLANITVINDNKTLKFSKYNDEKDGVTLILQSLTPLAQDSKNIYALAEVKVEVEGGSSEVKTYIQRISKSQGNKEDDAFLPSKVESFEINGDYYIDGKNNDLVKAAELIKGDNEFRVINDTLYVTKVESDNVEVSTIKLKKNKVTTEKESSTKYDLYLATLDDQDDQDLESESSYSIDAEGNTWALKKGKIYKFVNGEFEEVYTCDRTMDKIEVYNSKNILVWEEDEDVFARIGSSESSEEEITEDTTIKAGWIKNTDGTWSYVNSDGSKKIGWFNDNGTWYMLKNDGIMATGWFNDNGTWYYLNASGAMQTGWLNDNGTWYYLNASGAMQTGWFKDTDGRWYFLQSNGAMAVNTTIDGYVLGANGAWIR